MSSETRSPADTAFERRLLESARGDAQPRDVEQAWARFSGSLGAVLADRGGRRRPSSDARRRGRRARAPGRRREVDPGGRDRGQQFDGGAADGAAPLGRRTTSASSGRARPREGAERWGGPTGAPVLERPAVAEAPRAAKHHLARADEPAHRSAAPSTLAEQVSRIDTARVAITSGDYDEAMRLIERYHDDFPDGALAPDADVVALEAAAAKHDRAEVARRAASFLARYPNDPHTARVEWLAEHPRGR